VQEISHGDRWMVRLDPGEEIFDSLGRFARSHGIRAGVVVQGIGAVSSATVGYWNGREYAPRELTVRHELVALHGSIAEGDSAPSLHLHAALAGPDYQVVGGHLLKATIGIIGELWIENLTGLRFARPLDESLGLRRLDLHPGSSPSV